MKFPSLLVVVCVGFCAPPIQGKEESYSWHEGMCHATGVYDARKVSRRQLDDCLSLMRGMRWSLMDPSFFKADGEDPIQFLPAWDSAHRSVVSGLNAMRPPNAYWNKLRNEQIREVEQEYRIIRLILQSTRNPSILRQVGVRDSAIDAYVGILEAGGKPLMEAWRREEERAKASHCCKGEAWARYRQEVESPKAEGWARSRLVHGGWFNAVNSHLEHSEMIGDLPRQVAEFFKLFVRSEPDHCPNPRGAD